MFAHGRRPGPDVSHRTRSRCAGRSIPRALSATPSRDRIFMLLARPRGATAAAQAACAQTIIASLARRAYRRPVTADDVAELFTYYEHGAKEGGFEGGVRSAVTGILASPFFLYRGERVPAGRGCRAPPTPSPISSWRRSCRSSSGTRSPTTSCCGWPSPAGSTSRRCSIGRCARMLADPRSITLADNFVPQWLDMKRLDEIVPDSAVLPYASGRSDPRDDFRTELALFADSIFREDRSVVDLLTREPHLPQRARGAALRHHRREGGSLPPRRAGAVGALGPAGQGRRADGGGLSEPHVAGAARRLHPQAHPGRAAGATRRPTCRRSTRRTSAPPGR